MIIATTNSGLELTTQPDHAFFAAELLSLWRGDGFPEHPRRAEVLFAVREHDNGWREPDAAPRILPEEGAPMSFFSAPMELRSEIWLRGIDRFATDHPWASLLILEHAYQLHRPHQGEEGWVGFFEALRSRREDLLEPSSSRLSCPEEDLESELPRDYYFLELADLLSLAVCSRFEGQIERGGYRFEVSGDSLGLDPFPLAGATRFRVRCRQIPKRPYADAIDLAVTLATARWQDREVRVEPLAR